MDLGDPDQREDWRRRLGGMFRDRSVICAVAPLAGFTDWVRILTQAGARRPMVVASARGAGPVPSDDEASVVFAEMPSMPLMSEDLRRVDSFLRSSLPSDVRSEIDRYDPTGTAMWLVGPFVGTDPILGRPVVNGRPRDWVALEDKTVDVWTPVDAQQAPWQVVDCDRASLAHATRELDAGDGVVWSGDARDGLNGAGEFVRWVATEQDAEAAYSFLRPRCDRVRVMSFLDGVPCSIHGCVLPDGTATFRPVELAILRGANRTFVYGGQGSTWDPPPEDRADMRELARRVGELVRERVGYRGFFGIDGVLTADGFRPTELNPRMSAGVTNLGRHVDAGLFFLLQWNLSVAVDPGVTVAELEQWAVPTMDAHRFGKAVATASRSALTGSAEIPVSWDGTTLTRSLVADGWVVEAGTNPAGLYARLTTPDLPAGRRLADLNAALMRFLDAEVATDFGEVEAAPDVRVRPRH